MSGPRPSNAGPDAIAAPTRGRTGTGSSWLVDAVIYEVDAGCRPDGSRSDRRPDHAGIAPRP